MTETSQGIVLRLLSPRHGLCPRTRVSAECWKQPRARRMKTSIRLGKVQQLMFWCQRLRGTILDRLGLHLQKDCLRLSPRSGPRVLHGSRRRHRNQILPSVWFRLAQHWPSERISLNYTMKAPTMTLPAPMPARRSHHSSANSHPTVACRCPYLPSHHMQRTITGAHLSIRPHPRRNSEGHDLISTSRDQ